MDTRINEIQDGSGIGNVAAQTRAVSRGKGDR